MNSRPALSVWIGFDPREAAAFAVARNSVRRHLTQPIPIRGIVLEELQEKGFYTRPTTIRSSNGQVEMIDELSIRGDYDGRISTQHAIARFCVPHIAAPGWALFCDGDILFRSNVSRLFEDLDPSKAVYCVKHLHEPTAGVKMDSQVQTRYARKNWSSVMVWNVGHKANDALTIEVVNTLPGRDLHRLAWLDDAEIGELDPAWNWLVCESAPVDEVKAAHFTSGTPDIIGYENVPFADEWRAELRRWAT